MTDGDKVLTFPTQEGFETIPDKESVLKMIAEIMRHTEYDVAKVEVKRVEGNTEGPYIIEVVIPTEGGGHTRYKYMRKGNWGKYKQSESTSIECTYFDAEDEAISGKIVAVYENGTWVERDRT